MCPKEYFTQYLSKFSKEHFRGWNVKPKHKTRGSYATQNFNLTSKVYILMVHVTFFFSHIHCFWLYPPKCVIFMLCAIANTLKALTFGDTTTFHCIRLFFNLGKVHPRDHFVISTILKKFTPWWYIAPRPHFCLSS